jgi:hypothetical protein
MTKPNTHYVTVRLEVSETVTPEALHEQLCKVLHERDIGYLERLYPEVADIEVVEPERTLAESLCKVHQIREASYQFHRPEGGRYSEGTYNKDWEQCCAEAGVPPVWHPLIPLLMHWGPDTNDWVKSILGHYLDGNQ